MSAAHTPTPDAPSICQDSRLSTSRNLVFLPGTFFLLSDSWARLRLDFFQGSDSRSLSAFTLHAVCSLEVGGCVAFSLSGCAWSSLLCALDLVAAGRGYSSCGVWVSFVAKHGLQACGLSHLAVCGIFPDQGLNPRSLCWRLILNHWTTRDIQSRSFNQLYLVFGARTRVLWDRLC